MKKTSASRQTESPARLIDARIKELGDWRGKLLGKIRALIKPAVPDVVTFAKDAKLKDPAGLFNSTSKATSAGPSTCTRATSSTRRRSRGWYARPPR